MLMTDLEVENRALREAAEPFKLIADFYDNSPPYTRVDENDVVVIVRPNGEAFHLTYQHCAAMRAAMGGRGANYDPPSASEPPKKPLREWLVIEDSASRMVFGAAFAKPPGYIPRDVAEPLLGRDLGGTVWFTREEGKKMRMHPEWRDTEPLGKVVPPPSASEQVVIWSGEHNAWWRFGDGKGNGYTTDHAQAGRWPKGEAVTLTRGYGPEKGIVLEPAPSASEQSVPVTGSPDAWRG
jgi:hypothetical protein